MVLDGGIRGVHMHLGWIVENNQSLANFEVINGSRVFWNGTSCGKQCLKDQFPNLLRLDRLKNAMVQELLSWNEATPLEYNFLKTPK